MSINIYKLGHKILEQKAKSSKGAALKKWQDLRKKVYEQQIKYFPKNLAKVYSDYGEYLYKIKEKQAIYFPLLQKAYDLDPAQMGIKAIGRYFNIITNKYKDTDVSLIFSTFDRLVEAVTKKMDNYTLKLDKFAKKQENKQSLSLKEKRLKRAYEINSRSLGKVESILDKIIVDLSTCERLIPLYKQEFQARKTDALWLKSAVTRMYKKNVPIILSMTK